MSVWEGILSLSHSTICPWCQSTIYLSGSAYHPSVNSLYVCPRGRTILESLHCMPVPVRVPSFYQSTVCLSERAYHPRVISLYACPVARTTLESAQYMPLLKRAWFLIQSTVRCPKSVASLIQSILWLAGRAYHPCGNPLHAYFYFAVSFPL